MSENQKRVVLEFAESITSKPAGLYLLITKYIMENPRNSLDDFFENQPTPQVRVHKSPEDATCVACEG